MAAAALRAAATNTREPVTVECDPELCKELDLTAELEKEWALGRDMSQPQAVAFALGKSGAQ